MSREMRLVMKMRGGLLEFKKDVELLVDLVGDLLDGGAFPGASEEAGVEHGDAEAADEDAEEREDPVEVFQRLEAGRHRDPWHQHQTDHEETQLHLGRPLRRPVLHHQR